MSWHILPPNHPQGLIAETTLQCLQSSDSPWRDITAIPRGVSRTVIDVLQKELDSAASSKQYRSTCIKCLRALVRHHDMLPSSFFCGDVRCAGTHPVSGGGFADIWKGSIDEKTVCIKVLRLFTVDKEDQDLVKDCYQEALVWKQLRHQNVLPFLGVNEDLFAPSFCLISPWMENGNIVTFLREHHTHNRIHSLLEIAEGLKYLHELDPQITHADIRGANILIDSELHCRLADFGLSIVSETRPPGSSAIMKGSLRWLPPEMMDFSLFDPAYLISRDIYSFGCTVIEIYTGKPPFSHIKTEVSLINEVVTQKRKPPRPPSSELSSDELWDLVEACLATLPQDRPPIDTVLTSLKIIKGCCLSCPFLAGVPCPCVIPQTSTMASHKEDELPLWTSTRFNAASQAPNPVHEVAEYPQFPEIASHTPTLAVPSPANAHQLVPDASIRTSQESSPFRWVRGNRIGSEPYAQIYRAINISSGKRIVVKQVQTVDLNDTLSQTLRRLSDALQASDHPNVLDHLGFEQTASSTNIFLEYFPSQTLQQFIEDRGKLGHSEITKYFLSQIVSGLAFLHSKDIVHWDLRIDTIFVNENGLCKISGFSISKYIGKQRLITPADRRRVQLIHDVPAFCAAPEDTMEHHSGSPGPAVDIWSLGLIAYALWMGLKSDHYSSILSCVLEWGQLGCLRPPKGLVLPETADDFRRSCLAFAPEQRLSAEQLREHEYLRMDPSWRYTQYTDPSA